MGRLALGLCLACLSLPACGDESESNTLGGSVSRVYSLDFDTVRARRTTAEFAVQYVQAGTVPVQLVIDLTTTPLEGSGEYPLENGSTVVGSRAGVLLPEFVDGRVSFSSVGATPGSAIVGEFSANVATEENTYAVFGTFDTTLEILD
jgi:hypothetical protein